MGSRGHRTLLLKGTVMPARIVRNPVYSFIVLVLLSLVVGFLAVMVSLKAIHDNNQGWCNVITTLIEVPVPKPTRAEPNYKSQVRAFDIYEKLVDRSRTLGC
jgi:hypothetical protein